MHAAPRHGAAGRANISAYTVSAELVTSAVFPGRVEPGVQLGSYEVLLCIARGGMASVWAAREHAAQGRLVALKTVLPELAEPEFENMFREEARVGARIHHPNVCEVFELVEEHGVLALAMEWVDGDTLNGVLGHPEQQAVDTRLAAYIVAQVARGLHAAHELVDDNGLPMQLVHRDVSPQNILISRSGRVKVADFGVAKGLGGSREQTEAGRIKGKLSYMSPEQAEGKALDRRSDVYALGVVLYVATVGVHPFRGVGDNRDEQLLRLLVGQFEPPSSLRADYPADLEAIVLRAMQREPEDRFASADEMRLRLDEWLAKTDFHAGEHQVGRLLAERLEKTLEQRSERLQRCLLVSHQLHGVESQPGGVTDVTFMPTSRGVSHTLSSLRARVPSRPATRGLLTALAAATLGVIGTLAFTGHDFTGHDKPVPERASEGLAPSAAAAAHEPAPESGSAVTSTSDTHAAAPDSVEPAPAHGHAESERPAPVTDSGLSGMAAARRRAQVQPRGDEARSSGQTGHPQRLDASALRSMGSALNGAANRRRTPPEPVPPPSPVR
jgi:serine/threonine protein kinase